MKKIFKLYVLLFVFSFFLVGCGTSNSKNIINKLDDIIKKADSYYVTGIMEINNNEDTYTYDVTVSYKKDNYYKVDLINTLNNHEQVILRNDDGVYVVTPSLNKSFKFQSDWPYNNSQIYLLDSILSDLKSDDKMEVKSSDKGYILSSLVNYPNNKSLYKQNVYVDNNNISKVEIVDKNNKVQISMKFDKVKYNKKFDDNYFDLSNLIKINSNNKTNSYTKNNEESNNNENNNINSNSNTTNPENNNDSSVDNKTNESNSDESTKTKQTATIDDVIYPMYLPDNTTLANKEVIDTKDGQRLILTFDGDNPFILVEETSLYQNDGLIVPVSGDLEFLTDVIGAVSDNSVTWESNGIEYYLVSDVMKTSELIDIARSINVLPVSK